MNKQKTDIFSDISERILKTIDYLNVTPNKFGEMLGYNRSQTIYDIINRKSKPSFDFFYKYIISEYSEIVNVEWLITGKGSMLKSSVNNSSRIGNEKKENTSNIEDRLLSIIESQQRTIEYLSKKGDGIAEEERNTEARKTS